MKKIIFISLLLFFLTGCSIIQTVPAKKQYSLNFKNFKNKFTQTKCKQDILKINTLNGNALINSNLMYYMEGKYKINSYTQSQWSQIPIFMINSALIKTLRDNNIFKAVLLKNSFANANLILEINVENFLQFFTKNNKTSFVKVKIHFTLINSNNDEVIASKTQIKKLEVKSLDAIGGVRALNIALKQILLNNSLWIQNICKKGRIP